MSQEVPGAELKTTPAKDLYCNYFYVKFFKEVLVRRSSLKEHLVIFHGVARHPFQQQTSFENGNVEATWYNQSPGSCWVCFRFLWFWGLVLGGFETWRGGAPSIGNVRFGSLLGVQYSKVYPPKLCGVFQVSSVGSVGSEAWAARVALQNQTSKPNLVIALRLDWCMPCACVWTPGEQHPKVNPPKLCGIFQLSPVFGGLGCQGCQSNQISKPHFKRQNVNNTWKISKR